MYVWWIAAYLLSFVCLIPCQNRQPILRWFLQHSGDSSNIQGGITHGVDCLFEFHKGSSPGVSLCTNRALSNDSQGFFTWCLSLHESSAVEWYIPWSSFWRCTYVHCQDVQDKYCILNSLSFLKRAHSWIIMFTFPEIVYVKDILWFLWIGRQTLATVGTMSIIS